MLTAQEVLDEFSAWLEEIPDSPAKRVLMKEPPPRTMDVMRAMRNVQVRGRLEKIVLVA